MALDIHTLSHLPIAWQLALIIAATFVQEDVAALMAGAAVAEGKLSLPTAIVGVFCGVLAVNLFFWALGRLLGPAAFKLPFLRNAGKSGAMSRAHDQFERSGFVAILVSRFVPGTRIPICALAGVLGMSFPRYLLYSLIAIVPWTAVMLLIPDRIEALAKSGMLWWSLPACALIAAAWWMLRRKKGASSNAA